tara:strand:+ start:138101 stop:138259 length:159 start_codon:yes stop_codon:yes gene_type:complete
MIDIRLSKEFEEYIEFYRYIQDKLREESIKACGIPSNYHGNGKILKKYKRYD